MMISRHKKSEMHPLIDKQSYRCNNRVNLLLSVWVCLTVCAGSIIGSVEWGHGAVITFQDGTQLTGEIIDPPINFPPRPGMVEIVIGPGQYIMAASDTIVKIETDIPGMGVVEWVRTPIAHQPAAQPRVELGEVSTPTVANVEAVLLYCEQVRGWAQYQSSTQPLETLEAGHSIHAGETVLVHPNTRVYAIDQETLSIGIASQTEVQFNTLQRVKEPPLYQVGFNVLQGSVWLDFKPRQMGVDRLSLEVNGISATLVDGVMRFTRTSDGTLEVQKLTGEVTSLLMPDQQTRMVLEQHHAIAVNPEQEEDFIESHEPFSRFPMTDFQHLIDQWYGWLTWEPISIEIRTNYLVPSTHLPELILPRFAIGEPPTTLTASEVNPPVHLSISNHLQYIRRALHAYQRDTEQPFTNQMDLNVLINDPDIEGWQGPYLPKHIGIVDPWGTPFVVRVIRSQHEQFLYVYSCGPNRKDEHGLGDDIH